MGKMTVLLPKELKDRLRRMAADRGISLSALIREAIEERLERHRPKPKNFGMGASDGADIDWGASDLYKPDPWRS